MAQPTILLSAGEPSGDLHGAGVARALRQRWPGARLFGLGGPRMAAEGVELLAPFEALAVMGFVEVASRLPYFIRLLRRVRREMNARGAQLVIPIDYPGFNLRLSRRAREDGARVLYYIAPQVWAWHRSRMKELAQANAALRTFGVDLAMALTFWLPRQDCLHDGDDTLCFEDGLKSQTSFFIGGSAAIRRVSARSSPIRRQDKVKLEVTEAGAAHREPAAVLLRKALAFYGLAWLHSLQVP